MRQAEKKSVCSVTSEEKTQKRMLLHGWDMMGERSAETFAKWKWYIKAWSALLPLT